MSNTLISILTFAGMAIFGLLIFRPVFAQYVDAYQVRIRARKESNLTSAEKPRDSMILLALSGLGQIVLTSFPAVADQRTIVLLTEANYRTPQHLAIFTGIRAALTSTVLLIGLLAAASNPVNLLLTLPAAVLVWLVPNFFLSSRASKRKQQILRELPIIIDLLIVCAQAGLGLLQGIDKIAKEVGDSCPILTTELKQLINDVKMFAKSAPMALREMGERCGSDELINLASALIAAESKGADMSYPLKQQADAMRDRLKRKKEEEAGKVPVKMVPVIMIFIMPLILAPMLGPAVVVIVSAIDPILKTLK